MKFSVAAATLGLTGAVNAQSGYGSNSTNSTTPTNSTSSGNSTIPTNSSSPALPIVDLGYELHQATSFNATGRYYNFLNIRYAAPPIGNLRFKAPQSPAFNRSVVQDGSVERICPQAAPAWYSLATPFITNYLTTGNTVFNASFFGNTTIPGVTPGTTTPTAQEARVLGGLAKRATIDTTEDCLFLDVVVPQEIYESRNRGYGAPVLVWIYGGGYTAGSKSGSGNPAGLLSRSEADGNKGVIYVSLNYRLGAFGWLSGPTFQKTGTANAGLHDQRFALEWVKENIALFGGDPNRVTVFGESAGGGSIMHQITAYGGEKGPVPFAQAVLQSPGWQPLVSNQQQEQTLNYFLGVLNVSTIEEARTLSTEALQAANRVQIKYANYGSFIYGPSVDGDFVPQLPGELLLHGQFDKSVRVMVGHNAQEGLLFTPPFIQNNTDFITAINTVLPTTRAWPDVTNYISSTLYPAVYDGSQAQGYKEIIARAAAFVSELIFTCNTFYLDKAYNNMTYAYFFTVPPALHGFDIPYTYYNGPNPSVYSATVALALQEYITSFAETGNPNDNGVPYFNMYGNNATVQTLAIGDIREAIDPTANARCDWWQKALYV
ncbi:hypothetical protein LTR95_000403 [Oleoguttula sp. CCFEE 5521]